MKTPVITLSANTSWFLYNFCRGLIIALQDQGYGVVCIVPDDLYATKLQSGFGCRVVILKMNRKGTNPLSDLWLTYKFLCIYREIRPLAAFHYTIKNNIYGTWAAAANRIPAINNVSGLGTAFIRGGVLGWVVKWLYRTSQVFASVVYCLNPDDREVLLANNLVPKGKIRMLPGAGVDVTRFMPCSKERARAGFVFLFAGRMLADKGLRELVAALEILYDRGVNFRLCFSGLDGGDNLSAISQAELDSWRRLPYVEFLGPSDQMEAVYPTADCVVLPSYREGIPSSLLEAGACGIPVITTDVPGCRDVVVDGKNGLLCAPYDEVSLADQMQRLTQMSDEERALMGVRGRALVKERFSEKAVVEENIQTLRKVLTD